MWGTKSRNPIVNQPMHISGIATGADLGGGGGGGGHRGPVPPPFASSSLSFPPYQLAAATFLPYQLLAWPPQLAI